MRDNYKKILLASRPFLVNIGEGVVGTGEAVASNISRPDEGGPRRDHQLQPGEMQAPKRITKHIWLTNYINNEPLVDHRNKYIDPENAQIHRDESVASVCANFAADRALHRLPKPFPLLHTPFCFSRMNRGWILQMIIYLRGKLRAGLSLKTKYE